MEIFKLFGSILINNDEANASIDKTDKKAGSIAETFGNGLKTVTKWGVGLVAAVGTAATALGGLALGSINDFQSAMNGLQASTGATDEEMSNLQETVRGIYGDNFGEGFEDIASSVSTVNKFLSGTGENIQVATEKAIALRDTFGYDVSESMRAVDQLMKQFGVTSDEAYNLISQGAQQGLDFSGEMIDSIVEYSVHFQKAGMDAEDMFNILLSGTQDGAFNLDKIGDAVKEFNIRLVDGSKTTEEGLKMLGFNTDKVAKNMATGGEVAQKQYYEITEALAKMNDKQKQNIAGVDLFGTMWEDLGPQVISSLQNMNDTFNRTYNSMEQINKVKYNTIGEAFEGLKRQAVSNVLIPFGQQLLPTINEFSNWFIAEAIPSLNKFSGWISNNMPTIQGIVITVFSLFGDSIKFVIDNANWLIPVLGGVLVAILALNVITTVKGLMDAWKATTFAQTLAQEGLNVALRSNPIGLVITAIGLLVTAGVLLYKNWDTIKTKAVEVFGVIRNFVSPIIDGIENSFKGMVNGVIKALNTMIRGLNKLNFKIPDWVPGIGGGSFGFNLREIPSFAVGTRYLPSDMLIQAHEGEMIVPKSENPYANSDGDVLPEGDNSLAVYVILDSDVIAEHTEPKMNKLQGNKLIIDARGAGLR